MFYSFLFINTIWLENIMFYNEKICLSVLTVAHKSSLKIIGTLPLHDYCTC